MSGEAWAGRRGGEEGEKTKKAKKERKNLEKREKCCIFAANLGNSTQQTTYTMTNKQDTTPKRQSKAGEWLDAHPGGIAVVTDWRAVNR